MYRKYYEYRHVIHHLKALVELYSMELLVLIHIATRGNVKNPATRPVQPGGGGQSYFGK